MSKFSDFITSNGFKKVSKSNIGIYDSKSITYSHDETGSEGLIFQENWKGNPGIFSVSVKDKRLSHQQNLEGSISSSVIFALSGTFTNFAIRYNELHSIITKGNDVINDRCKKECEALSEYMKEIQKLIFKMDQFSIENEKPNMIYNEGDIMVSQCGYDQTITTFYMVTKATPKTVTLRECQNKFDHHGEGHENAVIPNKDHLIGDSFRRKIDTSYQNSVRVNDCEVAFKWDGNPVYETDPMFGR